MSFYAQIVGWMQFDSDSKYELAKKKLQEKGVLDQNGKIINLDGFEHDESVCVDWSKIIEIPENYYCNMQRFLDALIGSSPVAELNDYFADCCPTKYLILGASSDGCSIGWRLTPEENMEVDLFEYFEEKPEDPNEDFDSYVDQLNELMEQWMTYDFEIPQTPIK